MTAIRQGSGHPRAFDSVCAARLMIVASPRVQGWGRHSCLPERMRQAWQTRMSAPPVGFEWIQVVRRALKPEAAASCSRPASPVLRHGPATERAPAGVQLLLYVEMAVRWPFQSQPHVVVAMGAHLASSARLGRSAPRLAPADKPETAASRRRRMDHCLDPAVARRGGGSPRGVPVRRPRPRGLGPARPQTNFATYRPRAGSAWRGSSR